MGILIRKLKASNWSGFRKAFDALGRAGVLRAENSEVRVTWMWASKVKCPVAACRCCMCCCGRVQVFCLCPTDLFLARVSWPTVEVAVFEYSGACICKQWSCVLSNSWAVQSWSKSIVTRWFHFCQISQGMQGGVWDDQCYGSLDVTVCVILPKNRHRYIWSVRKPSGLELHWKFWEQIGNGGRKCAQIP